MKFLFRLILSLGIAGFMPSTLMIYHTSALWAQDHDDEFGEDEDEDDDDAEEEDTSEKQEEKTEKTEEKEDEFADEDEQEREERKEEEKEEKEEKEDKLAREKEKERLQKEALEREKARKKAEQERIKRGAKAEEALREAKKKAAEQKRKKYGHRIKERASRQRYARYYTDFMRQKNVSSHMPARRGFAFAIGLGFMPNTGNSVNEGFTFSSSPRFYENGFPNPIATLPLDSSGFSDNKGVADVANFFKQQVNVINKALADDTTGIPKGELETTSGSITTFPIAISAFYLGSFYLIRAGVNFHHSVIGFGGTNRFSFSFSQNSIFFEHESTLIRLEVPISFALRFLHSQAYGAYLGGGINFFWGQNTSEFSSTQNVPTSNGRTGGFEGETDRYSATAFGFHFLMGIEAEIWNRTYLTVELFQNFGVSSLVEDSSIGFRSTSASGAAESDRPDRIKLNFSGTEIIVSVRRFI